MSVTMPARLLVPLMDRTRVPPDLTRKKDGRSIPFLWSSTRMSEESRPRLV